MNKKWFFYLVNILTISFFVGVVVWSFKIRAYSENINLHDYEAPNNSQSKNEAQQEQTFNPEKYGYFSSGLWPGEGIPRFRAKIDLTLSQEPSLESPTLEAAILPLKFSSEEFNRFVIN